MEVKIKKGSGYVEADWTIEDGVMVVSPKVEKYEPKDGDVVVNGKLCKFVFIYEDNLTSEAYFYVGLNIWRDELLRPDGGHIGYVPQLRPATEEEKKKLFDKLAEEGWEWKADTKELVRMKWKPKLGEKYYHPILRPSNDSLLFEPITEINDDMFGNILIKKGWTFRTKDECEVFCEKLNDAINSVKP